MPISESALEARARRQAHREGLQLRKLRSSSPYFVQYGPYMLVDERNNIVASCMSVEQVHGNAD